MVNLKLYSWVERGRQRIAVLKSMSKPQTPTETRHKSKHYNPKISLNNTSDVLRSFVRNGIAVCLNNEAKTGRLYQLTSEGEKIRVEILKE